MEQKKGFDKNNLPLIGSKWRFEDGSGPLTVKIIKDHCVFCLYDDGTPWDGDLAFFRAGRYSLLESGEVSSKKGLDEKGRPIIGSIWEAHEWPGSVYKVREYKKDSMHAQLTMLKRHGIDISPDPGHSWSWQSIATTWKLISIPDPDAIPTLTKKSRVDSKAWELSIRKSEQAGELARAKEYALKAPAIRQLDEALLAEEKAVEEKRVFRYSNLEKLGAGDKAAWQMRGLKPFIHYADQMPGWFWYI